MCSQGSCYGPIKVDSLSSSCNSNYDCFRLLIPYAREHLAWSVMFDSCNPELGPDLTFNDLNFLMDPDADNLSSQVPSFFKWNLQDTDALLNMLQEFLLCYKDYQVNEKCHLCASNYNDDIGCHSVSSCSTECNHCHVRCLQED